MCGIVAVLRTGERPLPRGEVLHRMGAAIAHRGPDDCGAYLDDDVMLGAVRLAIVDPTGGHQPVEGCSASGITAVYNGEVYDASPLRSGLLQRGHRVHDACDTTLIPHLYEEHGADLVHQITGMFALALWDRHDRRLLIARDRLGIKPLYYAQTRDFLVLASEIKAILASGLVAAEIDREALDDVFSLSYPCPPRTMFRGVRELRPAHRAFARPGAPLEAPQRYWRAPFPPRGEHRRGRPDELVAELRATLRGAVRSHLVADAPLGVCVSGGIDSSAVAALATELTGTAPPMVSVTFDDPAFDESEQALRLARHLGGSVELVRATADAALRYRDVIWSHELPLCVPGPVGGMLMGEVGRQRGTRVALTGDGADEIFGGYDLFRLSRLRRSMDGAVPRALRGTVLRAASRLAGLPAGMGELLADADRRGPDRAFRIYPPWYPFWHLFDVERRALLSPDERIPREIATPPNGFEALVHPDHAQLHPLDAELALEIETRLPSWVLVISDRTAMFHGIETRVPFLDHRVVELVAALPPSLKMRGLGEKRALRAAVTNLLPPAIRRRRKRPFMAPIGPWFFGRDAPEFVSDALAPAALGAAGLFSPDVVSRLRQELVTAPVRQLRRTQLEIVLLSVLGTQLLHSQFVCQPRIMERQRFELRHADGTPVPSDGL